MPDNVHQLHVTHDTHNRQKSKSHAGFEPTIPASEWPQTHALDRSANGIGVSTSFTRENCKTWCSYIYNISHLPLTTLRGQQSSTYQTGLAAETIDFPIDNFLACKQNRHESLNPLKPELNLICYLLALLGAHHILHVSRIRVKLLTFRRLMSYIYGAPILDVSRSHTTTQHSR